MNSKKLILLLCTTLLTGIIIGGLAVYFIKPGNIKKDSVETEKFPSGKTEIQLWTCPMHPEVITDEPGDCPKCGMKLVPVKQKVSSKIPKPKDKRKILYWRAPMDPTEIYDRPGKSKMGMDLIPVYEDEQVLGRGGTIMIDPITVQNLGVKTTKVRKGDLRRIIRTIGTIAYDERKLYRINTKISGWIEKLYVNFTGQEVKKGDLLLEIYSPELVSTQEEYLLALKNRDMVKGSSFQEIKESAESLVKSTRRRLELWDIPESEIEALEKRGTIVKTMKLLSPANGIVVHKNVEEGMFVKEGMDLFHIADLSTVWVYVTIYEYELPWVKIGQEAEMELAYIPGKTFKGKVDYIYPYLTEKTRDIKVRLIFPNPNLELKPDMYANVRIYTPVKKDTLIIPDNAVIRSGERNIVFVVRGKGKFEPREIKLGVEGENNYIQVISGLLEGEEIVTSAQFLLDSESRMQEAIQKMIEEKRQQLEKSRKK
jgi:Cu(I)/Ag(I) efflux system membrane fusion protein/cobalt-zinc-cadmium efflux system membrane fusion protein